MGSTWGLVDPIGEVASWLHACGSGTGSGGPWERDLACMQLRTMVMQLMFLFWGLNFGVKVRGDDEINFEGC